MKTGPFSGAEVLQAQTSGVSPWCPACAPFLAVRVQRRRRVPVQGNHFDLGNPGSEVSAPLSAVK